MADELNPNSLEWLQELNRTVVAYEQEHNETLRDLDRTPTAIERHIGTDL